VLAGASITWANDSGHDGIGSVACILALDVRSKRFCDCAGGVGA
jgi:hypothetical protein